MKILCGLGNPGTEYEKMRHNAGAFVINFFVQKYDFPPFKEWGKSLMSQKRLGREKIILMKPQTYMNLSGEAVREVMDFYKIQPKDILIIYDDVDLPLGKIRFRLKGSAGSHNGMKSLIQHLSTMNFPRLRIGIESRDHKAPSDLHDFVLSPFLREELPFLRKAVGEGIEVLENWIFKGKEV